jgi:RNA polymerase sigma-70 factor (ECF subfamily)
MSAQVTTHTSLLLRLAEGSDSAAWREFHDRYGDLIRGFTWRRGLQRHECEDVVQDVLMSLTKAMPSFRYDPAKGKFRSYLKTATLRAVFRRSRQKCGEVNLRDIEEATQVAASDDRIEEEWEQEWRQYHLRQAMRVIEVEFSSADREAFQRYAVQGGDARETAAALNMSVDQVYQAKSRITKRLSEIIAAQVAEEG